MFFAVFFFQDLDVRKSLKAAKDKLRHWDTLGLHCGLHPEKNIPLGPKIALWHRGWQAKRLNILRSGDMTGTEN
jgi:hypothetical protein